MACAILLVSSNWLSFWESSTATEWNLVRLLLASAQAVLLVVEALAIVASLLFLNTPNASNPGAENAANLAMFPPIILGLAVARPWARSE